MIFFGGMARLGLAPRRAGFKGLGCDNTRGEILWVEILWVEILWVDILWGNSGFTLWVEQAVQVQRGWRDGGLAEQPVHLPPVMGLMVEEMGQQHRHWLRKGPAFMVDVRN